MKRKRKVHQLPLWFQDEQQNSNRWYCAACHACDSRIHRLSISSPLGENDITHIVTNSYRICNSCGGHITPVKESSPKQKFAYRAKLAARKKGK